MLSQKNASSSTHHLHSTTMSTQAESDYQQPPVNTNHRLEEFDLLAGHDFGNTQEFQYGDEKDEPNKILVWQKVETSGFQPAAREGHTAVTNGLSVILFGGFEAGKRINSTVTLDIRRSSWVLNDCKGNLPPPRCFHAACSVENLMIVHGGEGMKAGMIPPSSSSLLVGSPNNPPHLSTPSQSTDPSKQNVAIDRTVGKMKGVCPGDNLNGSKLTTAVKVKHGAQVWSQTNLIKTPSSQVTNVTPNGSNIILANLNTSPSLIGNEQPSVVTCLDDMYALDTISYVWYPISCALSPLPRKGHTLNSCYLIPTASSNNPFTTKSTEKELTLLMFGGYSIENITLSNSLFVCEAKSILQYYEKLKKKYQKSLLSETTTSTTPGDVGDLSPILWRSLSCRGTSPSPRYRHSSCIALGNSGETLLIIIGGIGKDPKVALNDIYILDVQNFTWVLLKNGSDCLSTGIGGDGPVAGIYGHVSFPVMKSPPKPSSLQKHPNQQYEEEEEEAEIPQYEILVFGGSSNTLSMKSSCYSYMFAFDLGQHKWRKVDTGHTFPSSRSNHSVSVIEGWSPTHPLHFQKTQSSTNNNNINLPPSHYPNTDNNAGSPLRTCAVVFGGSGAIQCAADTWALDLQWKHAGVNQYDNNIEQLIQENIQQTDHYYQDPILMDNMSDFYHNYPQQTTTTNLGGKSFSAPYLHQTTGSQSNRKIHTTNNQKYLQSFSQTNLRQMAMIKSASAEVVIGTNQNHTANNENPVETMNDGNSIYAGIPIVEETYIPSGDEYEGSFTRTSTKKMSRRQTDTTLAGKDEEQINELIMKLRKERALTDIQLHQEKNENILLNEKIHLLSDELLKTQEQFTTLTVKSEQEIKELKLLLLESQKREHMLKQLNQEAYQLLTLQSMEQVASLPKTIFPFNQK